MILYDKDVGVRLNGTIRRPDGTAFNLTGATVVLFVPPLANSPFSCTITSATAGQVSLTTLSGQWPAGDYLAQYRVVVAGQTLYTEVFPIIVARALG